MKPLFYFLLLDCTPFSLSAPIPAGRDVGYFYPAALTRTAALAESANH